MKTVKKVERNTYLTKNTTKLLLLLSISIISISFLSLILISSFNTMVADDSYYFQWISNSGIKKFLTEHYNHLNGRFGQFISVGVLFKFFGELSIKLTPIFLVFSLAGSISLLIYNLIPFKNNKKILSLITGSLLSVAYIFSLSSLTDSLLWMTSSTVYLTSVIFIVLNTSLIVKLIKEKNISKKYIILSLITIIIGQGFSELSSLFVIGWLILITSYLAWNKNQKWKYSLLLLVASVGGFMINYISPGTSSRLKILPPNPLGWLGTSTQSLHPYVIMFSSMSYWWILIIILTSLILIYNLDYKKISSNFKIKSVFFTILLFLSSTYAVFFASTYSMGEFFPYRNLTLPNFGIVSSVTFLTFTFLLHIKKYINIKAKTILVLSSSVVAILFITLYAIDNLKILSTKQAAFQSRKRSIVNQIHQNKEKISINAVPVMYNHSNATEIDNLPLEKQVDWMVKGIKSYYNIPDDKLIEIIYTSPDYCVYSLNVKNNYRCK